MHHYKHLTNSSARIAVDKLPKDRAGFFSEVQNYHGRYGAGINLGHIWFKQNITAKKRAIDDTPNLDWMAIVDETPQDSLRLRLQVKTVKARKLRSRRTATVGKSNGWRT